MATNFPVMELPPALILEVLKHLDARELSTVACVCRLLRALASADHNSWKNFYCERWGLPHNKSSNSWRDLYLAREAGCKALLGKFSSDRMVGHTSTIRTMRMLPSANLVASGGDDSCIRLWDLNEGLPLACSPRLESTIRAIAMDANILATGGTSGVVRIWNNTGEDSRRFDVFSRPVCVREHSGPISCLDLDCANLYSGSWDMKVKVWNRKLISQSSRSLAHWDWVFALVARGHKLLSTAGSDGYTWDIETGKLTRFWPRPHEGKALAVEGNLTGNHIITGGEDGTVRVFDDRIPSRNRNMLDCSCSGDAIAAWIPHSRAVNSLAFDDPWLISGSADGTLAMMDLRYVVRSRNKGSCSSSSSSSVVVKGDMVQRMLDGGGQGVHAVDIGSDRIICAGRDTAIRVWDFSRALDIQRQVQASRNTRRKQKGVKNHPHEAADVQHLSTEDLLLVRS